MQQYYDTLINRFKENNEPYLKWENIVPIGEKDITLHESLTNISSDQIKNIINKICILKLNGGLGTTMGCIGPKGLIKIKNGLSFIDITIEQVKQLNQKYDCNIPLIFMNSFYTTKHMDAYVKEHEEEHRDVNIMMFEQNSFPRLIKSTQLPVISLDNIDEIYNNSDLWYPPGHGDLCRSIYDTGLLDKLIGLGYEYIFVSNIDNLGATLDFNILNELIKNNTEFALELTNKTLLDVKGGTLINYHDKFTMFEVAQCEPSKLSEFVSIDKFKYFNTNNVWIQLNAVKNLVQSDFLNSIDIIVNNKKFKDGRECIQLEYSIGALIKYFTKVDKFVVSRSRFIPVKTNSDLLLIKSNIYDLDENHCIVQKNNKVPIIKLDSCYNNMYCFEECFQNIPNIDDLDELIVYSDVRFGHNVKLCGKVILGNCMVYDTVLNNITCLYPKST